MKIIVILATAMCMGSVIAYPQISEEQFKSEVSRPMGATPAHLGILWNLHVSSPWAMSQSWHCDPHRWILLLRTLLRSLELGRFDRNNSTPRLFDSSSVRLTFFFVRGNFRSRKNNRYDCFLCNGQRDLDRLSSIIYLLDIDKIYIFDTREQLR